MQALVCDLPLITGYTDISSFRHEMGELLQKLGGTN